MSFIIRPFSKINLYNFSPKSKRSKKPSNRISKCPITNLIIIWSNFQKFKYWFRWMSEISNNYFIEFIFKCSNECMTFIEPSKNIRKIFFPCEFTFHVEHGVKKDSFQHSKIFSRNQHLRLWLFGILKFHFDFSDHKENSSFRISLALFFQNGIFISWVTLSFWKMRNLSSKFFL